MVTEDGSPTEQPVGEPAGCKPPYHHGHGAEGASWDSDNLWHGLVDAATVGIYIVQDGTFQYVNPQFEHITGYTSGELLGTYPLDYVHPDDREAVRSRAVEDLKGQSSRSYEFRFIHKRGDWIWILERVAPVQHNGRRAAVGCFMDITARKRAEEGLRYSEEKYRVLVERANDGIVVLQDEVIKFANGQLARLTGYSTGELEGTQFAGYLHPDEVAPVLRRYSRRMAGEEVERTYQTVLRHKDGSAVPVEVNAGVILYEGRPADFVFIRDITERKRAEEEVRRSERKYRTALESARDGILILDGKGNVVDVNQTCMHALGCSAKD
ncbi:MAG: PAS domain S-box protein, partial [Chloroflexota bacterium]